MGPTGRRQDLVRTRLEANGGDRSKRARWISQQPDGDGNMDIGAICSSLCAVEEYASQLVKDDEEEELNLKREEISKLDDFVCFEIAKFCDLKRGDRVFDSTWVLARLAMRDLKAKSTADHEQIHCPTPSVVANNILEFKAAYFDMIMIVFDVVSAFPHAQGTDRIFRKPPTEWINDYMAKFGAKAIPQGELLWWMKKAL